jgi:hypothetical protein
MAEWFITAGILLGVVGLAFLYAWLMIQFIFGVLNG